MTGQGVKMVETELEIGKKEISFLANNYGNDRISGLLLQEAYRSMVHILRNV